jgi:ketopantoate hydroxymethyltransferase
MARVRTHHLREMKERGERFTMLTSYDTFTAQVFDEAGIDVHLIGDSAASAVLGRSSSLLLQAATSGADEVRDGTFPGPDNTFGQENS